METTMETKEVNGTEAAKLTRKFVGPVYVEISGVDCTMLVRAVKSELCIDMANSAEDLNWTLHNWGDELIVHFDTDGSAR